jgi:DNA-directed RNA polymerase specialized sigma24 family protein
MTSGAPGTEHAERFTLLRPLLFTIAYEILGSATESDDVLQDSYLRWAPDTAAPAPADQTHHHQQAPVHRDAVHTGWPAPAPRHPDP